MANRERIALVILALFLSACLNREAISEVRLGALSAEVPLGWTVHEDPDDRSFLLLGEDAIGRYLPKVSVLELNAPATLKRVERRHAIFSNDSLDKLSPIEKVTMGGLNGWMYTRRYMNMDALLVHDPNPPEPTKLEHLDREYELNSPAGSFSIKLSCPAPLEAKCAPVFERFLKSLKVAQR